MDQPKDIRGVLRWGLSIVAALFGLFVLTPLRLNIETWTAANGLDRLWDQSSRGTVAAVGEWLVPAATFFIGAALALWTDTWLRRRAPFHAFYPADVGVVSVPTVQGPMATFVRIWAVPRAKASTQITATITDIERVDAHGRRTRIGPPQPTQLQRERRPLLIDGDGHPIDFLVVLERDNKLRFAPDASNYPLDQEAKFAEPGVYHFTLSVKAWGEKVPTKQTLVVAVHWKGNWNTITAKRKGFSLPQMRHPSNPTQANSSAHPVVATDAQDSQRRA